MSSLDTLLSLIKQYGTVREFSAFLQSRGLSGGNTWQQLIDDRLKPALCKTALLEDDLLGFLCEIEEHGKQHVFLYRYKPLQTPFPNAELVQRWLTSVSTSATIGKPTLVDCPESPSVAEVRYEHFVGEDKLTIKIVETRIYTKLIKTSEQSNDRITKEYQRESVRAVNVVSICRDGLIEIRIPQHENGSKDYRSEINRIWFAITELINPTEVSPINLVKAKSQIYKRRHELEGIISFSGTLLRNSEGINVTAACGRQTNLFNNEATEAGLATMVEEGHAYHDVLNLWWVKQAGDRPSQDVHVLLGGDSNEFAITRRCSRADYEHILSAILRFNQ